MWIGLKEWARRSGISYDYALRLANNGSIEGIENFGVKRPLWCLQDSVPLWKKRKAGRKRIG